VGMGSRWERQAAVIVGAVARPRCYLCGGDVPGLAPLCDACLSGLPRWKGATCAVCGCPVEQEVDLCRDCALEGRPYAWARALGPYEGDMVPLIQGLKYEGERALARPLADLLAPLCEVPVRWVTCVPMDPRRYRQRGHHPARELAVRVAGRLGTPFSGLLTKVRASPPQTGRPWKERRTAVNNLFRARRAGAGEGVLVVDDVYTSGATVEEAARALRCADYGDVYVLTATRTSHAD